VRSLALLLLAGCGSIESAPTKLSAVTEPVAQSPQVVVSPGSRVVVELQEQLDGATWYDDVFVETVDADVKLDVKERTTDRLVVEVSGLWNKKHPPASGVAVRLELDRSHGHVLVHPVSRWWHDRISIGQDGKASPHEGESVVADGRIALAPMADGLGVRFELQVPWSGGNHQVSGSFTLPSKQASPFLDAWNAARAAEKR
jgi:hypothetical protein